MLSKIWGQRKSFTKKKDQNAKLTKSKSFAGGSLPTIATQDDQMKNKATIPEGYFSIYVGSQKEIFLSGLNQ